MIDVCVVGWRVWYSKGQGGKPRVFNSVDHRWEDLPAEGVLVFCLYQKTRPRRRMMIGVSRYWHVPEERIYACDNREDAKLPDGLEEKWIKEHPGPAIYFKDGLMIRKCRMLLMRLWQQWKHRMSLYE